MRESAVMVFKSHPVRYRVCWRTDPPHVVRPDQGAQ
jgi:hypothetical protein